MSGRRRGGEADRRSPGVPSGEGLWSQRLFGHGDVGGAETGVDQHEAAGRRLVSESAEAERWSRSLGIPFYEAAIETNGHNLSLVFADLVVDVVAAGHAPFAVPDEAPDFKIPMP
jgi:hypothetical protein